MSVRQRPPQREAVGQHFLRSSRLAADIVGQAHVARGDLIVEVGGGTGALTQPLVRTGATVIAIERDPVLAARLRRRFERDTSLTVVGDDAAAYCWPREPFAVVANLPFAASGTILAGLLRDPLVPMRQADVIVQWEFAAKHAAVWPATLRSSHWRAWYDVSIVRRLHRTAFSPPPSVDAAVLRLTRRSRPLVPPELGAAYWEFLASAFAARSSIRRALRSSLSPLQLKRLAPALGFALDALPRDLDAEQWGRLFAAARGERG